MISPLAEDFDDTIVAIATPQGIGAIGVVRLSGENAIEIANSIFKGKDLTRQASHTIHYGQIVKEGTVLDEVVVSLFKAPHSYTKENVVEISTHGSPFVLQELVKLLISHGARLARPGEFTKRAFLNGRFDLVQAEAVADLISADSRATHMAAMNQMRGGFSKKIKHLRDELIHFASLIELELDFAEEDVEFANRGELVSLIQNIQHEISTLINSFDVGNAIKHGVPTVIAGKPNTGKSTLLNTLIEEEKAIVSDIPGTTRDVIEDVIHIEGISFRFFDTAGLREAKDRIEAVGVQKTKEKMKTASVIIYLVDATDALDKEIGETKEKLDKLNIPYLIAANKADKLDKSLLEQLQEQYLEVIFISAATEANIDTLKKKLLKIVHLDDFSTGDTIVTNLRHIESLTNTQQALDDVLKGIGEGISGDLLALDIRQALHHLGTITGKVTTDDLLGNIFSKFCIGK